MHSFRHYAYLCLKPLAAPVFRTALFEILQHLVDQTHFRYTHPIPATAISNEAMPNQDQGNMRRLTAAVSFTAPWIWRARTSCLPSPKASIKEKSAKKKKTQRKPPLAAFRAFTASRANSLLPEKPAIFKRCNK